MSVKTVTEIRPITVGQESELPAETLPSPRQIPFKCMQQMASIPCDEKVEVAQIELSLLKTTFKSFMMVESLALLFQTVQAK